MEADKGGAYLKGQGHEEKAGVATAGGFTGDPNSQTEIDQRHSRHQPEVSRVVLPMGVDLGAGKKQPKARHRQGHV